MQKIYLKTLEVIRKLISSLPNHNKNYDTDAISISLKNKKINIFNGMVDKKLEYFNVLHFGSINQQLKLYGGVYYSLNTSKLGFDKVFNPSIIQYNNKLFMTFRVENNMLSRIT